MSRARSILAACSLALGPAACSGPQGPVLHADGLDERTLPAEIRADYEIFADRCSKCHALSRPLNSGIDDDGFWKRYVERMRAQPASGISPADEVPILRFLHHYSLQVRRAKAATEGAR